MNSDGCHLTEKVTEVEKQLDLESWQCTVSHPPCTAAVFGVETNSNYLPATAFSRSHSMQVFVLPKTQDWAERLSFFFGQINPTESNSRSYSQDCADRSLFCLRWRKSTENSSITHRHPKRELPLVIPAMAVLREYVCRCRKAVFQRQLGSVLYTSLYLHKFQDLVLGAFWHVHVK